MYRWYFRQTENQAFAFNGIVDSVKVVDMEDINGHNYYKMRRFTHGNSETNLSTPSFENGEAFYYLKDSLGYFVDNNGFKHFDISNHDIFLTGVHGDLNDYKRLTKNVVTIETEANTFECLELELFSVSNIWQSPSHHHYYSNGVGDILRQIGFTNSPFHNWERRLESYTIQ